MQDLVLIPGLGSDAAVWARTITALGDACRCTVGDTLQDLTLAGMAARVLANAPAHFALAGVSMGGMVALEIMRIAPERVERLALSDTNARPDTPEQTAYRRMANSAMLQASDLIALAKPAIRAMVHTGVDPSIYSELEDMTLRVGAKTYVRQNEAVLARADLRPVLSTIHVPTVVVVGAQDTMTPIAYSKEIRDGISTAVLHVISDCGHLPPIEKPQVMAELLKELMAE